MPAGRPTTAIDNFKNGDYICFEYNDPEMFGYRMTAKVVVKEDKRYLKRGFSSLHDMTDPFFKDRYRFFTYICNELNLKKDYGKYSELIRSCSRDLLYREEARKLNSAGYKIKVVEDVSKTYRYQQLEQGLAYG